jgi:DNA-binding PadR family transcriptional regulator
MASEQSPPTFVPMPSLTFREEEVLLAYLAGGPEELDPIRIMKGMFIFEQESRPEWRAHRHLYEFEPYNWGPFSAEVYRHLDALVRRGLVMARSEEGKNWKYYQVTPIGRRAADEIRRRLDPEAVEYLDAVRRFTLSVSFHELLRAVYRKYPAYAVNSVFQY